MRRLLGVLVRNRLDHNLRNEALNVGAAHETIGQFGAAALSGDDRRRGRELARERALESGLRTMHPEDLGFGVAELERHALDVIRRQMLLRLEVERSIEHAVRAVADRIELHVDAVAQDRPVLPEPGLAPGVDLALW